MKSRLNRKHPRLKEYDYSLPGFYYVTIHGATPEIRFSCIVAGANAQKAEVHLSALGQITQQELLELEQRYNYVRIDKYVIMPTHIHAIIELAGPQRTPRDDLTRIVGVFKSLCTRKCNLLFQIPNRKLFQTSFYETVLRNEQAYLECWNYIEGNPGRWLVNLQCEPK